MKVVLISLIVAFIFLVPVEAANVYHEIELNMIKYDPSPVEPGSDMEVWVQVKNIGETDVEDIDIVFVPRYPFSLAEGESALRRPGAILKDRDVIYRYRVHVDRDAPVGTNKLEVGYRDSRSITKKEFDIEVGREYVNTRGTVELESYAIDPQTVMPGDKALVTLTLKNGAKDYTVKIDGKEYSMNAYIRTATLIGTQGIEVTSQPYRDVGALGPGDSLQLYFNIQVDPHLEDGRYFLDFKLEGSARLYEVNWKIPVTVDSNVPQIVLEAKPTPGEVVLNVANTRPNTIYGAAIIPEGGEFEPSTYFIGTMEPDEEFTVKFTVKKTNPRFKARFRNGQNWHETPPVTISLNTTTLQKNNNIDPDRKVLGLLAIPLLLVGGFFFYMKRKRKKESEN